jgi:hypothetical protein
MNIHLLVFLGLLIFWIFLFRDIRHSIKSYSKTKKYLIILLPPYLMSSQLSSYLSAHVLETENITYSLILKTVVLIVFFAIHLAVLKKYT